MTLPRKSCRTPYRVLIPLTVAVLLAACGTTPTTPDAGSSAPSAYPSAGPSASSGTPRRGGYYMDDGPDENPPDNLAAVPDAVPRMEPLSRTANRPYTALGQSFTPSQQIAPFTQRGVASWYGKKFHGARTSSGEVYDMYAMTAAHPTLPIPSYARVTNLDNGRAVVVRINDRGPFHAGRVIDLSYTAAWKLGYVDKGSARVEVQAIVPGEVSIIAGTNTKTTTSVAAAPAPTMLDADPIAQLISATRQDMTAAGIQPVAADAAHGIFLQLGVFADERNADSFRDYVQTELKWLTQSLSVLPDAGRYRLQLGPFDDSQTARDTADRIAQSLKLRPFLVQR